MELVNGSPHSDNPHSRELARSVLFRDVRPRAIPAEEAEEVSGFQLDIPRLARKYWWLLLGSMLVGAGLGFTSIVFSSPMYRARVLLEVQEVNEALLKGSIDSSVFEANEVNIQTQVAILRTGTFLKRGADRLQADTVPLAPLRRDLFSRIRQRVHPSSQDPLEGATIGLGVAMSSFNAQPVNRTRLIELTCDSTSPDVAAQFLNSMAQEFVEDTSQSHMQSSQKTSEWLAGQIEDTKSKLADGEQRLRDFVQASGNLFAGQDGTLDDSKLSLLKGELAKIQSDRIAKKIRYDTIQKTPPESLADVLGDDALRDQQQEIASLQRQKAALLTTLTPKNEKVMRLDAQLSVLQATYQKELKGMVDRISADYEAANRHEKLLASAYAIQSQQVGSEAGKSAEFNSLKREVETLRQTYQTLLSQATQAGISSSVPVNPIRIVEPAVPAEVPYSPVPPLNISIGAMLGTVFAGGLIFLREKLDRSIKSPGSTRRLMNVPELGVIPTTNIRNRHFRVSLKKRGHHLTASASVINPGALATWQNGSPVAESFRGTLTSILRNQVPGREQRTILVTSPRPGEGKSTVVQNLGIALAETGKRVLLIDADFRRPQLHKNFHLPNSRGLIDLLSETASGVEREMESDLPQNLCLGTGIPGLSVLPNHSTEHNVSKALHSPKLREVFEKLKAQYDMVLVDAPPLLGLVDARILAGMTDATILVLRCGVTDEESASAAHRLVQADGMYLLGTILTDWDTRGRPEYSYRYMEDSPK